MAKLSPLNPPNLHINRAVYKSDRPPLAVTDKLPVAIPEPEYFRQASPTAVTDKPPVAITDKLPSPLPTSSPRRHRRAFL